MLGDNKTPSKEDTPSKSEKKEEKEPERRGSTSSDKPSTPAVPDKMRASFPALPSNTTDSVRIKCRELLCVAIKGDEAPVDGMI